MSKIYTDKEGVTFENTDCASTEHDHFIVDTKNKVDEIVELAKGLIRADSIQESAKATIAFRETVTKALTTAIQERDREVVEWIESSLF